MTLPAYLPIEPLLLLCAARHEITVEQLGDAQVAAMCSVDVRTVNRWRTDRRLTVLSADRVAIGMGMHPAVVWGAVWFEGET